MPHGKCAICCRWRCCQRSVSFVGRNTLQTAQTCTRAFCAAFFCSLALCPCCFLTLACFSAALCWDCNFCCPLAIVKTENMSYINRKYTTRSGVRVEKRSLSLYVRNLYYMSCQVVVMVRNYVHNLPMYYLPLFFSVRPVDLLLLD